MEHRFVDSRDAAPLCFRIVTPCRNYAHLLDATVMSVLSQAGDFILHYHVQDGASADDTLERLAFWSQRIAAGDLPPACRKVCFTFDSRPDRGLYDAINHGFAALGGGPDDVLTWINASDLLVPGALATVASFLRQEPQVRWVAGRRASIDRDGFPRFIDARHHGYPRRTLAAGLHVGRSFQWVQPEGMMWRRSLWQQAGGVDPTFRLAGDFDLWRRFAAHDGPVVLDRLTGVYRFHDDRLSGAIDRYYAEADAQLTRLGLDAVGRAVEAEFIERAGAGDVAGLHAAGLTAPVARRTGATWHLAPALPDAVAGWDALHRRLAAGT